MNQVSLVGRLTKDPELVQTSTGIPYCRFTVAVNRIYGDKGADFINCIAWRAQASGEYQRRAALSASSAAYRPANIPVKTDRPSTQRRRRSQALSGLPQA